MKLRIYEGDALCQEFELDTLLDLGRQRDGEPEPYAWVQPTDPHAPARLVIASREERTNYSRHHLRLEPLPSGAVRVTNCSQLPLTVSGARPPVPVNDSADLMPPFRVGVLRRTLEVVPDEPGLRRLSEQTLHPGGPVTISPLRRALPPLPPSQLNQLIEWLQATMGVIHSAIGTDDFLAKAAQVLVEVVGLQSGYTLLRRGGEWVVVASWGAVRDGWRPSRNVLEDVCDHKHTVWERPGRSPAVEHPSLEGLHTVVASPLRDGVGGVIGALYGELPCEGARPGSAGGKLEALLVELLAGAVSAGLARMEQQRNAVEVRTLLNQFFTPQLAEQLLREPELLCSREARVTVLFCDIRNFSAVSELLGPAATVEWINDVLGELSRCVLDHGGVLVNYIGDELLAMWGAPVPQSNHAVPATEAALAMLQAREELERRWRGRLRDRQEKALATDLGIGLNTGDAQVGNIGTAYKYTYGPLGPTVNLASRVQGLTKYLGCRLLVTEETHQLLARASFLTRRVCQARVVNISRPVQLYAVEPAGEGVAEFCRASEEALNALEGRDFAAAAHQATTLLQTRQGDGPLLLTLSRAAQALLQGGAGFDPIWNPPGK